MTKKFSHQDLFDMIIGAYNNDKDAVFGLEIEGGRVRYYKVAKAMDSISELKKRALSFLEKRERILDVGAGTGRTTFYLQGEGYFNVFALDNSATACNFMRKKGIKKIIKKDFFKFCPFKKFDTVLIFDTPSLWGGAKGFSTLLRYIEKKIIKKNGKVIFTSQNPLLVDRRRDGPSKKITNYLKRRFILGNIVGSWFESIYDLSPPDLMRIIRRENWYFERFEEEISGHYFAILRQHNIKENGKDYGDKDVLFQK